MKNILIFFYILATTSTIAQEVKLVSTLKDTDGISSVTFSPDGKYVVTTGITVKIWETASGKLFIDLGEQYHFVVFSHDGKYLATTDGNIAKIWETAKGKMVMDLNRYFQVGLTPFSPDGKYVVTAAYDNTAKVWEIATGRLYRDLKHTDGVGTATFSPDGKYVVTTSDDFATSEYNAKIWDTITGKLLRNLKHSGALFTAAFSPKGKYVVTTSMDYKASNMNGPMIKIWEAATGNLVREFESNSAYGALAFFSPDEKYVIIGGNKVWKTTTGESLSKILGYQGFSYSFSPDGKHVLAGLIDDTGNGYTAKVWETATTKLVKDLVGHANFVTSAAFSPDGKYVVTTPYINTAKIWETAMGRWVKDLEGHSDVVISASFSANGKHVITLSKDGTAKLWEFLLMEKSGSEDNSQFQLSKLSSESDTKSETQLIQMEKENGVYKIPCKINGLYLQFIIDTGASDVSISLTEALFMLKNGYLGESDIKGVEKFMIANGQIAEGTKVILRSIKLGKFEINDVEATIVHNINSPLLFGLSALQRFGKIEIDYENQTLKLGR